MVSLKKIWVQIRDCCLFFFRNAIIITGYVDDHTWSGIRHRNWGDDLNYYFIREITGRPVIFYHNFWLAKKIKFRNYLCIGTLLDAVNYSNHQTIVWGSGVSGQDRDLTPPQKICSVRGKLTREFLINRHIDCPESFGDPALLLPLFYKAQEIKKTYKLGIIPHVIDLEHDVITQIRKECPDDILIIDLCNYKKWTDVIDLICSCKYIASSSLHGLIVSDAYGVPNCWIELLGKISGGHFKFHDYASSVNRHFDSPYRVTSVDDLPLITELCKQSDKPVIDAEAILSACPLPIKNKG